MTTDVERVEDTLERLRAELPETFTMEWLDNHRDDVVRAYEEYGPSRLAVSLSISVNSLKTWKQRRSLADRRDVAERRSETPAEDTGHTGVVLIPLDKIEANPWQTRKTIDPEDLQTLAESIDTSGLLQTPLGRRLESGVVQLAFGHRRVEAIRLLAEAGRWDGGAPVALRELTDLQMAVFAMEENAKRKDINHLEQLLGYQRVIQDGLLTVTELADTIGLARPTLSNNLRILYLTDTALEHFGAGDLSAHAARELVVFRSEDHRHDDDIDKVFARIKNPAYGAPDWSVKSVRSAIFDRVVHENKEAWRPLEKGVRSSYGIPNFDVDAFAKEFPTLVHHIPIGSGDGSKLWTCNVREWRRLQSAATRASTNKANSDPPAKLDKREETAYLGALANDPVVQSLKRGEPVADAPTDSVSQETAEVEAADALAEDAEGDPKGEEYRRLNDWLARYCSHVRREEEGLDCDLADDAPEDCPVCSMGDDDDDDVWTPDVLRQRLELELLTDSQIEAAVVRGFEAWENAQGEDEAPIKVPTLGEGYASNWAEVQAELGTRAGFLRLSHRRPGFVKKLEKYDLPDGFPDLDECLQRCTWGAVYGQQFDGEKPKLYCTNQKHFEEKRARGKAEWVEGIQERARKEAEEDQALVQDLVFADQRTLLRHVAVTLMAEQSALEKAKIGGWDSAHLWYEYITSKRVRELLGVEALDSESEGVGYYQRATAVSFNRDQRRGSVSSEMVERVNALELPDLQHLVANLVAYTFRVRLSIVGGSPPQNEDTAGEGESIDDGEGDEGVDGELGALSV